MPKPPFQSEGSSEETVLKTDFPSEALFERTLNENDTKLLITQWNLFNELKSESAHENPIKRRMENGEKALIQGTLLHGTTFDIERTNDILNRGVMSGELLGIPENDETHYCADFFRVPEDFTVEEYLEWCAQPKSSGMLKMKKDEFNYLPIHNKPDKQIAFIVDTSDERLQELLKNDPYTPDGFERMKDIVNYMSKDIDSSETRTTSAILCGVPPQFISAIIISDGYTEDEVAQIKSLAGDDRIVFNTVGEFL